MKKYEFSLGYGNCNAGDIRVRIQRDQLYTPVQSLGKRSGLKQLLRDVFKTCGIKKN